MDNGTPRDHDHHQWHDVAGPGLLCLRCFHCSATIALAISITRDGGDWHVQILEPGTPPLQVHEAEQVMKTIRQATDRERDREQRRRPRPKRRS